MGGSHFQKVPGDEIELSAAGEVRLSAAQPAYAVFEIQKRKKQREDE